MKRTLAAAALIHTLTVPAMSQAATMQGYVDCGKWVAAKNCHVDL